MASMMKYRMILRLAFIACSLSTIGNKSIASQLEHRFLCNYEDSGEKLLSEHIIVQTFLDGKTIYDTHTLRSQIMDSEGKKLNSRDAADGRFFRIEYHGQTVVHMTQAYIFSDNPEIKRTMDNLENSMGCKGHPNIIRGVLENNSKYLGKKIPIQMIELRDTIYLDSLIFLREIREKVGVSDYGSAQISDCGSTNNPDVWIKTDFFPNITKSSTEYVFDEGKVIADETIIGQCVPLQTSAPFIKGGDVHIESKEVIMELLKAGTESAARRIVDNVMKRDSGQ